jgi:hypothetical protein
VDPPMRAQTKDVINYQSVYNILLTFVQP